MSSEGALTNTDVDNDLLVTIPRLWHSNAVNSEISFLFKTDIMICRVRIRPANSS